MKINACLYNSDKTLAGCITDSVISRFLSEFNEICKKFQESDYYRFISILLILGENLSKSKENYTADFLNCLKLIVKQHKNDLPADLIQKISRSYHNLIQYCCGFQVYDEVLNETINFFRNAGFEYRGKDIQGVSKNEHAFDYQGCTIGIQMHQKNDLYTFWNNENQNYNASVYISDKKYIINETSKELLVQAIKACISDCKESEEKEDDFDFAILAKELIAIAKLLIKKDFFNEL